MGTALFVTAHQDDETLMAGVAIAEHALVHDTHILCLTDGSTSGVLDVLNGVGVNDWWGLPHDPEPEGYAPLTVPAFVAARYAELNAAARCLGSVTVHTAGLTTVTSANAQAAITALADEIAPTGPILLKTHSHLVDNHADHIAAGQAAVALKAADPVRWGNLRHYILPAYWPSAAVPLGDPRLSLVVEKWDTPTDATIKARATNAARCYGAWAPAQGSYAIGYHSVWDTMFAPLLATPGPRSMYHA